MKVGDLVFLKNVGFPFHRADDKKETWEGASCIVLGLNEGARRDMVKVAPLLPISGMKDCLFFPEQVKLENRPLTRDRL